MRVLLQLMKKYYKVVFQCNANNVELKRKHNSLTSQKVKDRIKNNCITCISLRNMPLPK